MAAPVLSRNLVIVLTAMLLTVPTGVFAHHTDGPSESDDPVTFAAKLTARMQALAADNVPPRDSLLNGALEGDATKENGFALYYDGAQVSPDGRNGTQAVDLGKGGEEPAPWFVLGQVISYPSERITIQQVLNITWYHHLPNGTGHGVRFQHYISLDADDDGIRDHCLVHGDADLVQTTDWQEDTFGGMDEYRDLGPGCDRNGDDPEARQRPLAEFQGNMSYRGAQVMSLHIQSNVKSLDTWPAENPILIDDVELLAVGDTDDVDQDGYANTDEIQSAPDARFAAIMMVDPAATPIDWDGDGFGNTEEDRNNNGRVDRLQHETNALDAGDHPVPSVDLVTEATDGVPTGTAITFNATGDYAAPEAPEGSSIVSYTFDFGDGATQDGAADSAIHTFADDGTYTITVTATEDHGVTATASVNVTITNRAPTSAFTVSASTVATQTEVDFDASGSSDADGTIASYAWDLGDGTTAAGKTVTHEYGDDGNYTACLTVTDDDGTPGAQVCHAVDVSNQAPTAAFSVDAGDEPVVVVGRPVTFVSTAADADGSIVSTDYTIDGTPVNTPYTFLDAGTYTVNQTVTDDDATTDTVSETVTAFAAPEANFTSTINPKPDDKTVVFDASGSTDPQGGGLAYVWDLGDGNTSTDAAPTHTYAQDGTYAVTLVVTDAEGIESETFSKAVVLENLLPEVDFSYTPASNITTATELTLTADASDADGTVDAYAWDFGDGAEANGTTPMHTFVDNGAYSVCLTVTDDESATNSTCQTITVANVAPHAGFTVDPGTEPVPVVGRAVGFNTTASDDDGSVVTTTYVVDPDGGDPVTLDGANVNHAFTSPGDHVVRQVVTDDDGDSTALDQTVMVYAAPGANFTFAVDAAPDHLNVTFNANVSEGDGPLSYAWDLGDGNTTTGQTPGHTYADDGTYTVTLTVTDIRGVQSDPTTDQVTIVNVGPKADFAFTEATDDGQVLTHEPLNFTDNSTDVDGSPTSWSWDFGDGNTAEGAQADHAYTEAGDYTVTLTATDDDGATATASQTVTVLLDTDGDGTPDASDTDDDGDGWSDSDETKAGSDPKDARSTPNDLDGDGVPNALDRTFGPGADRDPCTPYSGSEACQES